MAQAAYNLNLITVSTGSKIIYWYLEIALSSWKDKVRLPVDHSISKELSLGMLDESKISEKIKLLQKYHPEFTQTSEPLCSEKDMQAWGKKIQDECENKPGFSLPDSAFILLSKPLYTDRQDNTGEKKPPAKAFP